MTRTDAQQLVRNLAIAMVSPERRAKLTPDETDGAMLAVFDILGWGPSYDAKSKQRAAKRIRAAIAILDADRHECGGRIVAGHTQNGPYYFCATCGDDNV